MLFPLVVFWDFTLTEEKKQTNQEFTFVLREAEWLFQLSYPGDARLVARGACRVQGRTVPAVHSKLTWARVRSCLKRGERGDSC